MKKENDVKKNVVEVCPVIPRTETLRGDGVCGPRKFNVGFTSDLQMGNVQGRSGASPTMTMPHQRGFTLIELLVVVLIIGILAAVALPQYQMAVAKSRLAQAYTLAKAIKNAEEVYYLENGTYTAELDLLPIDIGPVSATHQSSNWLSGTLLSTNGTIELAFNVGNGLNPRVFIGTPRVNNERYSQGAITFYFDHASAGDHRSGIHCAGYTEVYQRVCQSMGGTYIGQEGSGAKVYQLP